MKTLYKGAVLVSNFYDLTQGDWEIAENIKKNISECEKTVSDYLEKKNRTKHYTISGISSLEDDDTEFHISLEFSDEEVERIRTLIVDIYNNDVDESEKIPYSTNIIELCKDMPLNEIEGVNEELDTLLFGKLLGYDIIPYDIDFNHHYLYNFDVSFYDQKDGTVLSKESFKIHLTDEEYIYMLTQRLLIGEQFNYNRLILSRPSLAQRISECILDYSFEEMWGKWPLFVIHFTEINEDANSI